MIRCSICRAQGHNRRVYPEGQKRRRNVASQSLETENANDEDEDFNGGDGGFDFDDEELVSICVSLELVM